MSNPLIAPRGLDDPTSALPEGWLASRLVARCEIFGGGRLGLTKEKDYRSSGVIAFSAAGPDGHVDAVEIDGRDGVVLSAIGANCGRCFFASGQWTTLANVQAIIPKAELDAKYLFYYVNRDGYWARSGSAQPFIKPSSIQTSWVAYPPSKSEQSKIAEVLSTVDRAIAQTQALIAKQQRIKTGLMQDMLTRGIDEHGQLRSEATHAFKDSPLGRIPVEWEVVDLGDLLTLIRNGYAGRQVAHVTQFPVSRIETIANGVVDMTAVGFVESIPSNYLLIPNDILLSNINSLKHIGKVALATSDDPLYHGMNLLILRITDNSDAQFVFFQVKRSKPWFETMAAQAVNQASINQSTVRTLQIAIPKDRKEQATISDFISGQETAISEAQDQAAKLRHLKTALMQDLLTGKVRVTPLLQPAEAVSHG